MASLMNASYEMEKLSYDIFSILESKFLSTGSSPITPKFDVGGKVCILSIDSGNGLLAAVTLARLESSLRARSGNADACIANFFDVAAGSGLGGVLIAMLFTRGTDGKPLFSAEEALRFLTKNRRHLTAKKKRLSFRSMFRRSDGMFHKIFDESLTLRDTLKPVLIPCFDMSTGVPLLFSRADAMETDTYDYKLSQVSAATCAECPIEMRSVDGRKSFVAVGGRVAMSNPTAAAITHVLNNKQEFPFAAGVEDLLVVSLASGEDSTTEIAKIAANAAADTVDQAIAMVFGEYSKSNYVRIQTDLAYRNIESVLFRGRMISDQTNAEKLECFSGKLVEEQQRRKSSLIPTVLVKQANTPRTSSATTCTTATSSFTLSSIDDSRC